MCSCRSICKQRWLLRPERLGGTLGIRQGFGSYREAEQQSKLLVRLKMGTKRTSIEALILSLIICTATLIPQVCVTAQSYNDAVAYLNTVEEEVMTVAAKATQNFVATCGTLIPHRFFLRHTHISDIAAWLNTISQFYKNHMCRQYLWSNITHSALLYHLTSPKNLST